MNQIQIENVSDVQNIADFHETAKFDNFVRFIKSSTQAEFNIKIQQLKMDHKNQLLSAHIDSLSLQNTISNMSKQIDNYKMYVKLIENQNQNYQISQSQLKKQIELLQEWVTDVKEQKQSLRALKQKQTNQLQYKLNLLNQQSTKKINQLTQKSKKQQDDLIGQIKNLQFALTSTDDRLFQKQNDYKDLHKRHTQVSQEFETFKNQINKALYDFRDQKQGKNIQINEIDLAKNAASLIKKLRAQREQVNSFLLKMQGNNAYEEYKLEKRIQNICVAKDRQMKKLQNSFDQFQIRLNNLLGNNKQQINHGNYLIEQVQLSHNEYHVTIQDLEEKLKQSQVKINGMQKQLEQLNGLKKQLLQMQKSKTQQQSNYMQIIQTIQAQSNKQIQNIKKQLQKKTAKLSQNQSQLCMVKKQIQKNMKVIQQLKNQNQSNQNIFKDIKYLENKIIKKDQQIAQKNKIINMKQNQLMKIHDQLQTKPSLQKAYEKTIQQLKSKIQAHQNNLQKQENQLNQKNKQLNKLKQNISQLQLLNKKLQDSLNQLSLQKKELQNKKNNTQNEMHVAKNKIQYMQSSLYQFVHQKTNGSLKVANFKQVMQQLNKFSKKQGQNKRAQRLFQIPSLINNHQNNLQWITKIVSQYSGYNKVKSKFVTKINQPNKDISKLIQNRNTILICQNSNKKTFCIYLCKIGKNLTDNDPVAVFGADKQFIYPHTITKSKGYRSSWINPKGELILGKNQIVLSRNMQIVATPAVYFGGMDTNSIFGTASGVTSIISQIEIFEIIQG